MKTVQFLLHFFGGLALGMVLYAIHLLLVLMNLHGKATTTTGTIMALGLLWPILASAYGMFRARTSPISQLNLWWSVIGIVLTLLISILICLFLCLLIGLSGYPGYC